MALALARHLVLGHTDICPETKVKKDNSFFCVVIYTLTVCFFGARFAVFHCLEMLGMDSQRKFDHGTQYCHPQASFEELAGR